MKNKKITGIMACDPGGVIALNNRLPWNYPQELEFYRKIIAKQCVILGYNTFIEMPEDFLNNHFLIVFSKKSIYPELKNVVFVSSIEEFKKLTSPVNKKFYMIGGAEIATLFLKNNLLEDFLLTIITKKYAGDVFFNLQLLDSWPRTLIKESADFSIYRYINPQRN